MRRPFIAPARGLMPLHDSTFKKQVLPPGGSHLDGQGAPRQSPPADVLPAHPPVTPLCFAR